MAKLKVLVAEDDLVVAAGRRVAHVGRAIGGDVALKNIEGKIVASVERCTAGEARQRAGP